MSSKWEKIGGETGEDIPSSRWSRMLKMSKMGIGVSATSLMHHLNAKIRPGTATDDRASLIAFREKQAQKIVNVLGELKGASMKIGQVLSSDPDLIPEGYMDVLSQLQSDAPAMTYKTVQKQIETALDRPIESIFQTFDPEPIGSASIGQVHRGRLMTGEEVAVKIQFPGILETLESDLKNLRSLLTLGRAIVDPERLDEWFEECRETILIEADYTTEAQNMRRFSEHLEQREGTTCPKPFEEWTAKTVLTMELMEGRKLDTVLGEMRHGLRKQRILERFVETFVWMFHELFELHSDPHPGNFLLNEKDEFILLDFGCVRSFDPFFADGILRIIDSCWQNDHERAASIYRELGFGVEGESDDIFDPELLRAYHGIILEPFLRDRSFDFGSWRPRTEIQRFIRRTPKFLKLVPPAESLMYLRLIGGIKGLLGKVDGRLNVHRMARDTAERRGLLTGPPQPWD